MFIYIFLFVMSTQKQKKIHYFFNSTRKYNYHWLLYNEAIIFCRSSYFSFYKKKHIFKQVFRLKQIFFYFGCCRIYVYTITHAKHTRNKNFSDPLGYSIFPLWKNRNQILVIFFFFSLNPIYKNDDQDKIYGLKNNPHC